MALDHSPYEEQITGAEDEHARRRLLAEIGGWRARNLADIVVLRQAAYAMARLYALVGESEGAVREANSLVSLCQTHPPAPAEELDSAQALARTLGGGGVVVRESRGKGRKNRKEERQNSGGARLDEAREALGAGRLSEARALLKGARGDDAAWLRASTWLEEARAADPSEREQILENLSRWLAKRAGISRPRTEKKRGRKTEAPRVEPGKELTALEELVGPLPAQRRARIRVIEQAVVRLPDQAGAIALATLEDHVEHRGPEVPAPWLAGLVFRARLAGQDEELSGRLDQLAAEQAPLVAIYAEPPFGMALEAMRAMPESVSFHSLRRGVLTRGGEPDDRKVWTLRVRDEHGLVMFALVPDGAESYPQAAIAPVLDRIAGLESRAVVVAPGESLAALRATATEVGLPVVASPSGESWWSSVPSPAESANAAPPRGAAGAEARDAQLAAVLGAETLDEQALVDAVSQYRRVHHAFSAVRALELSDERRLAFLRAIHRAAPATGRLPEALTGAVALAASGLAEAESFLLEEAGERFGGAETLERVISASREAVAAGFSIHRVIRGALSRERREDPVLKALDGGEDGLWRLRLRRGDDERMVALLVQDTPESRAAMPRLLSEVQGTVLPSAAQDWYAGLQDAPPQASSLGELALD